MPENPSIYSQLLALGAQMDNHRSDLYVKRTPETAALLGSREGVTVFTCQLDGKLWYDVPFAFEPYWDAKTH